MDFHECDFTFIWLMHCAVTEARWKVTLLCHKSQYQHESKKLFHHIFWLRVSNKKKLAAKLDPEGLMAPHSLVSQLLLSHHHVHNVPKVFALHLLPVFGDVADADTRNLPQVLGCELEGVRGTASRKKKDRKISNSYWLEFTQYETKW